MVEPARIRELLDEFRFEDAQRLLNESDDTNPDLGDEVATRRVEAEQQAEVIVQRLIELGEKGQLNEFIAMIDDPVTKRMIDLASHSSRARVDPYVGEAERWRKHQMELNARRLGEARRALAGLDFELAAGLMRKVDGRFLSAERREERDDLLLEMSARTMEIESLEPARDEKKRRSAGRRRRST
ncbi:MAG: hypothetical protein WAM81_12635 [Acidimicrobiia bacterium]